MLASNTALGTTLVVQADSHSWSCKHSAAYISLWGLIHSVTDRNYSMLSIDPSAQSVLMRLQALHLLGAQQRRQQRRQRRLRVAAGHQVHDQHGDVISAPRSLDGHLQHLRAAAVTEMGSSHMIQSSQGSERVTSAMGRQRAQAGTSSIPSSCAHICDSVLARRLSLVLQRLPPGRAAI